MSGSLNKLLLAAVILIAAVPRVEGEQSRLALPKHSADTVHLQGLLAVGVSSEEAARRLLVFVANENFEVEEGTPPMLGRYWIENGEILFKPRFGFDPMRPYRVVAHHGSIRLEEAFTIAGEIPAPRTRLEVIFPTGNQLPENLLKFYLYFDRPMREGRSLDFIHLFHESGREVEIPFVETLPELWDPSGRRLTLILHPGRLKRGLEMRDRNGSTLKQNQLYRLRIDEEFLDREGLPLVMPVEKHFRVGPADRLVPDPASWRLQVPPNHGPLLVHFGEPIDHALLANSLVVRDSSGQIVSGEISSSQEDQLWTFQPQELWNSGEYSLEVDSRLEDLAGNRVDGLFDQGPSDVSPENPVRFISFQIP